MKKIVYFVVLFAGILAGNVAFAQHGRMHRRTFHNNHIIYQNRVYTPVPPRRPVVYWATPHHYNYNTHVYFPDYQVFYNPYRGGYEYMNGSRWMFSATIPTFLANVNLGHARIQIMSGVPITSRPTTYYNTYYRRYPPQRYRH